jgi:anion-transporting  ArsA/GET3 family ATPase
LIFERLLSRRLVIVSGKGGVGKSVVGLSLALAAREQGKRVLFAEIDAPLEAARLLDVGPVGPTETEIRPGLFALNLKPVRAMEEYVRRSLKVELLARRVLDSPIYQRFFAAAPGLKELMVLGKVMEIEERHTRRSPAYDLIVLDAPATGHGLSMLKVPLAAASAIRVGPIGRQASRLLELLRDARRTTLLVVSTPEEMAVVEALELRDLAAGEIGIEVEAMVMNACHERRLTKRQETEVRGLETGRLSGRLERGVPTAAALAAARHHLGRAARSNSYRARLRRQAQLPVVTLPFIHKAPLDENGLGVLSARIARQ